MSFASRLLTWLGHAEKQYALAMDKLEVYAFIRDDIDEHIVRVQGGRKDHSFRDDN